MSFSIHHLQENGLNLVELREEETGTSISVLPEFGALLHAFTVRTGDRPINIIDNYNGIAQLQKELAVSFKSSKLSPFPCRIPEGKYVFDSRQYQFDNKFMDGSAIHGLLYNKPFVITHEQAGDEAASLSLQYYYKEEDKGYPYYYECNVKYTLHVPHALQIQTIITNKSDRLMPVADGWHPYFRLGGNMDDWFMQFNAESILEFNDKLIPTGRLLEYDLFNESRQIGNTVLDNCFVLKKDEHGAACEILNPATGIKISFFPDSAYPYLQIYTPPHRQSIAIENLSGAPDCFNNKMGLLLLKPMHSQTFSTEYRLSLA
jgi:aldose 1-epimerase